MATDQPRAVEGLIVQCVCGRLKQQSFICDFCYSTEDSDGD